MEEEQNMLLFGSSDDMELHFIYARYAMGDPVSLIAADLGCSESQIHAKMRKRPEQYEETKKQREAFTGLRLQRSLSLVDAHNLRILEDITEGRIEPSHELMKELNRWSKDVAHRLQLHEGKATEITGSDEKLTRKQVMEILKEQEEAGDGLCTQL